MIHISPVCQIEVLMKRTKTILSVILLLITPVAITACSGQRSEADPNKWRFQSFEDKQPSLESYFPHPGPPNRRDRCRDPR